MYIKSTNWHSQQLLRICILIIDVIIFTQYRTLSESITSNNSHLTYNLIRVFDTDFKFVDTLVAYKAALRAHMSELVEYQALRV